MFFRRRSSSKPSSSRGWSKVRLTNRHDVAEMESWVDFASRNGSDDEEQISLPSLRKNLKDLFIKHVIEWRRG